jgi:hypothetical protein
MSAPIKQLDNGYARLIRVLRTKPARLPRRKPSRDAVDGPAEPEAASAAPRGAAQAAAPAGPPIEPRELPAIARRLTKDARVVLVVAALVIVLVTTLVIAVPAALDRIALQRHIAVLEADLAADRSRLAADRARDAARGRFVRRFTEQFMDPGIYKAAATRTAAFKPDGLDDEGAVIRSLLWQLKSHRGTAHFLAARKSIDLTVSLNGELPKLEWRERPSPLPALLLKLGLKPTDRAIRALNIQINRYGFTSINDQAVIARDVDGKLVVVKLR